MGKERAELIETKGTEENSYLALLGETLTMRQHPLLGLMSRNPYGPANRFFYWYLIELLLLPKMRN